MQFAAATCAAMSLGSVLLDPGAIVDPTSLRPILFEWNGMDAREFIQSDSLRIQDTLGQPVTAACVLINPPSVPAVGDRVRIFYHAQVIFAGTIDRVAKTSPDLQTMLYAIDCLDWTQTLIRRKIQRNFTDVPIQTVLESLLENEFIGEDLSIGTIESRATLPLVDSRSGKALDVLRDMAAATGQTFYLDFDQSIQMRSTLVTAAPLVLNEANVLLANLSVETDRETYRNVQTVQVTGTPATQGQDARTTEQQRRNLDQIAARQAIEGGSGLYEEVEAITHPTSNDDTALALLGISYARLRLATSGTPRTTARCQVRGYGFRAGQVATVALPTFGLAGTFAIQRVTIRELAGTLLFHDLELTNSSLQERAYQSWLQIVNGAKVTVQVPGSLTSNLQTFTTPGASTWTVPAGITAVEMLCVGGSGGGGGGGLVRRLFSTFPKWVDGHVGGNSGKAVSVVDVTPGEELTVTVGSAGSAGVNGGSDGTAGTDGTLSRVQRGAMTLVQADPGGGGGNETGSDGATGAGLGDAVSVGGGKVGGAKGQQYVAPTSGQDGLVELRW